MNLKRSPEGDLGIVALGEPMAEFSGAGGGSYELSFSGDPVNVAVSAARLGTDSAIIGAVGDDYFGRALIGHLAKEGVKTDGISIDGDGFTGLYFITLLGKGDHEFTYYRKGSSASRLRLDESQLGIAGSGKVFHFSGISQAVGREARISARRAARLAHEAGAIVSYDINFRPRLWDRKDAVTAMEEVADYVDIIFASTEDWKLLHGRNEAEGAIAEALSRKGYGSVIVKAGSRGSFGMEGGRRFKQRSYPVNAVDATGAGDAYDAGFLCGMLSGLEFQASMKYASMNAALKCTMKGGIRGLPTRRRLESAIRQQSR